MIYLLIKISINFSTLTCKRDGPKKNGTPRMIRVTFQDSSSVKTIFMNKSLLPDGCVVRKNNIKKERTLFSKAVLELKKKKRARQISRSNM